MDTFQFQIWDSQKLVVPTDFHRSVKSLNIYNSFILTKEALFMILWSKVKLHLTKCNPFI